MAVTAAPAPGWGWHCKKCAEDFGRVCSGHSSISVASGCDPARAVLRRDVIWGKKTQSRVILRNFCPVSHVPLKLSLAQEVHSQVPAGGTSSWSAKGPGFLIGTKSELAPAQVSATCRGRVSRAWRKGGSALKESVSAGR